MPHQNEITPPPDTENDTEAKECLRVWLMSDGLQMTVMPHTLSEDPGAWGIVLADIVEHVCGAYEHFQGLDQEESRVKILSMLAAELKSPTNE